jgi:hypothetical protein
MKHKYDIRLREIIRNQMEELMDAYAKISKLETKKDQLTWKQIINDFLNKKRGKDETIERSCK